jgi:hypothetical protein
MLTYRELVELERALHETSVLSVYLDGEAADPARRQEWRQALDEAIVGLRASLREATHHERDRFERCVKALAIRLAPYTGALGAPGFVAFVAPDGVRHAAALPVRMPTVVTWGVGARAAPYLRALKQLRPVIAAVVDSRSARLFRYADGELASLQTLEAATEGGPRTHMGDAPRQGFHAGTRGETGSALADRAEATGMRRLLSDLTEHLTMLAGDEAWVVVGGTPQAALAALASLPPRLAERATLVSALDAHASPAAIARAAEEGATALRRQRDLAAVVDVIDRRAADARGVLGFQPTLEALRERAVRELFVTPRALASHSAEVEEAVERAFAQDATVEEVSEEAARRLDLVGEGIGATLRFLPWTPVS